LMLKTAVNDAECEHLRSSMASFHSGLEKLIGCPLRNIQNSGSARHLDNTLQSMMDTCLQSIQNAKEHAKKVQLPPKQLQRLIRCMKAQGKGVIHAAKVCVPHLRNDEHLQTIMIKQRSLEKEVDEMPQEPEELMYDDDDDGDQQKQVIPVAEVSADGNLVFDKVLSVVQASRINFDAFVEQQRGALMQLQSFRQVHA
jgi:hypothetical protein